MSRRQRARVRFLLRHGGKLVSYRSLANRRSNEAIPREHKLPESNPAFPDYTARDSREALQEPLSGARDATRGHLAPSRRHEYRPTRDQGARGAARAGS